MKRQEIFSILGINLRKIFERFSMDYEKLTEIRLRIGQPVMVIYGGKDFFLLEKGELGVEKENAYVVNRKDIAETMEYVSNYSRYAYDEEVKQGFLTVRGGHRVGIAGKTVVSKGRVEQIDNISFLNIRLSHEKIGCAKKVMPYIISQNRLFHTLIISPPGCGKTTLLRDMIRMISEGFEGFKGRTVGVVDERSEIGACYLGIPQNDIGCRTDVLDCCPKSEGMLMLIRSMSPHVIAVDEIGNREDVEALRYVMNCGCKIIATVHGNSIDDIKNRPYIREMVKEHIFERYLILNNKKRIGNVAYIFDSQGNQLCSDGEE